MPTTSQMPTFRPRGGAQSLSQQATSGNLGRFLDNIINKVNKSQEAGKEKLTNISGISKLARMASFFTGPWAPLVNLAIGAGETYFSDKAYKDLAEDVGEQPGGGFLTTAYGNLPGDIKKAKKSALIGNLLKAAITTGMSAYQQGGLFPKGKGTTLQSLQEGAMAPVGEYGAANLNPDMTRFGVAEGIGAVGAATSNPYANMSLRDYDATRTQPWTGLNPNISNDWSYLASKFPALQQGRQQNKTGNTPFNMSGFTNYLDMLNQSGTTTNY